MRQWLVARCSRVHRLPQYRASISHLHRRRWDHDHDGAADADGDLGEGHQPHAIGDAENGDVAGAARPGMTGGHDRRLDRIHVQPPTKKPDATIASTVAVQTAM